MALIAAPLTEECVREVKRLLRAVPDSELSILADTEAEFKRGGFRSGNPRTLRLRLEQLLLTGPPVSDTIRATLATHSRSRTLLAHLAPETLLDCRHALAALLGRPTLLVALMLDARPEVRDKGESWMQQPEALSELSDTEAIAELEARLGDLGALLSCSAAGEPVAQTREAWRAQREKLEQRLRDSQLEQRRLKGVEERLRAARQELSALKESLDGTRRELDESRTLLKAKAGELGAAQAELQRELKQREARLAAALELRLAEEFQGWLNCAHTIEGELRDTSQDELLAAVESALHKQYAIDRHSGNRATLQQRCEELQARLNEVQTALRNAIRQAPELKEVAEQLTGEVNRLRNLLEGDSCHSAVEQLLAGCIHAQAPAKMMHLSGVLDALTDLGVIDPPALQRLRVQFDKRHTAMQATVFTAPGHQPHDSHPAALQLSHALIGKEAAVLLVDGHNALLGMPSRYEPQRGVARTEGEKRQMLIDDLVRLAANAPQLRVWLVFDGPTRSDSQAAANVKVSFSGGSGEHRADKVLLDLVRFFGMQKTTCAILLASNDRDLCSQASRLGAAPLPILELGAFFSRI